MPDLDLEKLQSTRVVLFGCGTLGCNVARLLLGWGVLNLSLVDYGDVSFSNPVRQSLFTNDDSLRPKVEAARDMLLNIHPTANIQAHRRIIPMPGHPGTTTEDIDFVRSIVIDHDVAFLLTDSRESRWLPTLLCAAHGKLCFNAALGFQSYMAMRHCRVAGCYFCPDVSAPGNSMRDRTLDEQCTVTRPGVSYLAAALAVEMMVAHLTADDDTHQVRGHLQGFQQDVLRGSASPYCVACSSKVIDSYNLVGVGWVKSVCDDPRGLQRLVGSDALLDPTLEAEIEAIADDCEFC
jgi:ubiquitin-like modifier-activating enzyme ATG7